MVLQRNRFNKEKSKIEAEQFFWSNLREKIKSSFPERVITIALDYPLKNSDINNPIGFSYKTNGKRELIGHLFYNGVDDPLYSGQHIYSFLPERNASDLVKKITSINEIHVEF